MKYIILAAGAGKRLVPLTYNYPKCLFKVGDDVTVMQKMIDTILQYDKKAEITTVIGYMSDLISQTIKRTKFVYNPFFNITNSVASLWFARDLLNDEVTIINGDIVMESSLAEHVITKSFKQSLVLVDGSITNGDYNAQVHNGNILVMSKTLENYYGEYAGVVKLNKEDAVLLNTQVQSYIKNEHFNQWYEDVLVQLIFNRNLELRYYDISKYDWTEIDCVDDLIKARQIHYKDTIKNEVE